jgi:hypothetical protein
MKKYIITLAEGCNINFEDDDNKTIYNKIVKAMEEKSFIDLGDVIINPSFIVSVVLLGYVQYEYCI